MTTPEGLRDLDRRVRVVDVDDLKPYEGNARRGDVETIKSSLTAHGQYQPLIVRTETSEILVGNHTWLAAKELGWRQIAVIYRSVPDDERARAIVLVDNRTSDLAGYSEPDLAVLLEGVEDLPSTGFGQTDLSDLLERVQASDAKAAEEPPVPDAPARPKTKRGDLIRLGDHRLLCGDSTDPKDVARLMGEDLGDLLMTSPPYNVDVVYGGKSEGREDWETYGAFLAAAIEAWVPAIAKGRAIVWNVGTAPSIYPHRQTALLEEHGLTYLRQMIWRKMGVPLPKWHFTQRNPVARQFTPNPTHEVLQIFATAATLKKGDRVDVDELCQHDVFEIHQSQATRDVGADAGGNRTGSSQSQQLKTRARKKHPAVFPVRLAQMFVNHLAGPGEIVVDPFGGAGTVALAAERLGRRAAIMEIDPGYCDVAIERWEAMTDRKARRPQRRKAGKKR